MGLKRHCACRQRIDRMLATDPERAALVPLRWLWREVKAARSSSGPTTGLGSLRKASRIIFSPAASANGSTPPHSCQPESSFFTPQGGERQALQALVAAREGAVNAKRSLRVF